MNFNLDIDEYKESIGTKITKQNSKIKVFSTLGWGFIIFGFLVGGLGIIYILMNSNHPDNHIKLHEIGDYLGGSVGSLWSLAGLFFIYVAFLGQQKQMLFQRLEIRYTQEELADTRKELRGQKEQMQLQNELSRVQSFENTFFNLLASQRNIVKSMKGKVNLQFTTVECLGDEYIEAFARVLINEIIKMRVNIKSIDKNTHRKYIEDLYVKNVDDKLTELGHYFRHLYHIVKYVDGSNIEDKGKYMNIIQAQMSEDEMLITFYNGISIYGKDKFHYLLEKYGLLENMKRRNKLSDYHKEMYYPNTNFK